MSRGGFYRSPDGQNPLHMRFGRSAPSACAAPCLPGDEVRLFGGRCARIAAHLCDFVTGATIGGKPITCDAPMCETHRTAVGPNLDHCPKHQEAR